MAHAVGMIEMGTGGAVGRTGRVVVSADLTGSMPQIEDITASVLTAISDEIGGTWALVSHKDYPQYVEQGDASVSTYGNSDDYAFRIESGWGTPSQFDAAVQGLAGQTFGGGDGPECYARVMWELYQPDTRAAMGGGDQAAWTLMVLDNYPHWRNGPIPSDIKADGPDMGRAADSNPYDIIWPYLSPTIDFQSAGVNGLRASGSKICVWLITLNNDPDKISFWSQYSDALVVDDNKSVSQLTSELVAILTT